MDWYPPANQNSSTSMEVSSGFSAHCVGQADPDYPGVCYLLHLMWPPQTVLHQQAPCPQVALELMCCYFQLLPQVCASHPTLCWSWWEANTSYVGSGCTHPYPWGIPHKLVHQDRTAFPQHIPYFPIYPEFCDDLWTWLHRVELCPQPPRLLLYCICHNCICGTQLPSLGRLWPFLSPFGTFPHFLYEFGHIWCCHSLGCQTKGNICQKMGLPPIHEIVGTEPCSWVLGAVIDMDQCSNVILLLWLLLWG